MEKRRLYMDYSATTPTKKEVVEEMMPYFTETFGNASSFHLFGREAKKALDMSRKRVASLVNADPNEIYFTNGGSESDNWALEGTAFARRDKGNHIITSKIEHHAILHTCEYLQKVHGFEVTYLDVNEEGFVDLKQLEEAITDKTILVSIMFANNEIGTIQPIKEIGALCREKKVLFHTDAVQAVGSVPVDVKEMNIDLLSLAGHKLYGPKGIGALYIRRGVRIDNLIHGGGQERGRRAGTENIPGVVGLGKAIEIATENIEENRARLTVLRDKLIDGILERIPYARLNGPRGDKRLPGNSNISFEFIEGESILLSLDFEGICASSGSACTSGSLDPSHVLLAIGLPHEKAHGSLRTTLGAASTEEDVEKLLNELPPIIERLRNMSPLWYDFKRKGER